MTHVYLVISAFLLYGMNGGVLMSFGVAMPQLVESFRSSQSQAAAVDAVQKAFVLGTGFISGFMVDQLDCHVVCILGSLLVTLGLILNIFATALYHVYITTGAIAGFGLGLQYMAVCVSIQRQVSADKRSLATGIVVSGGSIFAFVYAPLCRLLMDAYGWRGMYVIFAGLNLNAVPLSAVLRTKRKPRKTDNTDISCTMDREVNRSGQNATVAVRLKRYLSDMCDFSVLKVNTFRYFILANFVIAFGLLVPLTFLPSRAGELEIPALRASTLVSGMSIGDTLGRLAGGTLGTLVSNVFLYMVANAFMGLLNIGSYFLYTYWALMIYAGVCGFTYGCHTMSVITAGAELVGAEGVAKALGLSQSLQGIAIASTPAIAAYLWQVTDDSGAPFLFSGFTALCSSAILVVCFVRNRDILPIRKRKVVKSAPGTTDGGSPVEL